MSGYTPIHGKCIFWREQPDEDDRYDTRIKPEDRRVRGTCFVDGDLWEYTVATVPADCPLHRKCRYYIRHG